MNGDSPAQGIAGVKATKTSKTFQDNMTQLTQLTQLRQLSTQFSTKGRFACLHYFAMPHGKTRHDITEDAILAIGLKES